MEQLSIDFKDFGNLEMNGQQSDVEMTEEGSSHEKVAILDAGAQYGKVRFAKNLNTE